MEKPFNPQYPGRNLFLLAGVICLLFTVASLVLFFSFPMLSHRTWCLILLSYTAVFGMLLVALSRKFRQFQIQNAQEAAEDGRCCGNWRKGDGNQDSESETIPQMGEKLQHVEREVEQQKNACRKLQYLFDQAEAKYRTLIDLSVDPIMVYDVHGTVIDFNPAFASVFKWPREAMGELADRFVPVEEHSAFQSLLKDMLERSSTLDGYETKRFTRDGALLDVRIRAACFKDPENNPAGILISLQDLSGHKRMESQLIQSQKMEAIGTLAGGIAHDFNNILGAMMGYAEMLALDIEEGSVQRQYLQQVMAAGLRAKDLVKQILTFSRQKKQDCVPVQVDKVVTEALALLRASLPATIDIQTNINAFTGNIMADSTQVHQILMNLCTNAAHAMEGKGIIRVALDEMQVGPAEKASDLEPGPYIRLVVSDTGKGMDSAVLKRIFEPYFTTKEPGKGTGMGLAVVHGIVRSYGGTVRAASESGQGSTFEILFPKSDTREVPTDPNRQPMPTGCERILFVDDEKSLAELGKNMLSRLGYQVVIRTSPVEAVEAFRSNPRKFDLVVTDLTMPQMTGDVLAREIMKINPSTPVILCTGYSELMTEEKASASGIRDFFMKPFVMRDLATTVRTVLDRTA